MERLTAYNKDGKAYIKEKYHDSRDMDGVLRERHIYGNGADKLAAYEGAEEQGCEYKIHTPAEEGYPDIKGRYYECTCGANYIEIEQAQEWKHCPHCGKSISSFETFACVSCKCAEWDGDSYYCEADKGMYCNEEVTHANFDGCKAYVPPEAALNKKP